jgi:hypothetical protein
MATNFELGPYDPCPCGSGEKYKFCCAAKAKGMRKGKYPMGTVARYGPDGENTTKIEAGVMRSEKDKDPIIEKWSGEHADTDPKIADEIKKFFAKNGVKNVVTSEGNIGCAHEEGVDYPKGVDCPYCPFWAGMQGSSDDKTKDEIDLSIRVPDRKPDDSLLPAREYDDDDDE